VTPAGVQLRASDAERDRVLDALHRSCGEGRIDLEELDRRSDMALAARTRAELADLVSDLPERMPSEAGLPSKGRKLTLAVMNGVVRRGRWNPADRSVAIALMGGCRLDLRHVELDGRDLTITVGAVMGGVTIIVPDGVDVDLRGFAIAGGRRADTRAPRDPTAPRIIVRGYALAGGVRVRSAGRMRGIVQKTTP
jgi:DUF1707 SHOCT-like domain/Cell wall-active antibiotics response LiaF, C-terminal